MKLRIVLETENNVLIDKILCVISNEGKIHKGRIEIDSDSKMTPTRVQTVSDVPKDIDLSQGVPIKVRPYFGNLTKEEFRDVRKKLPSSLDIFEILKSRKFAVHSMADIMMISIGHVLNTKKEDPRQLELYQLLHARLKRARGMFLESIGGHFLRKCIKENGRRFFVYYHPNYIEGESNDTSYSNRKKVRPEKRETA